MKRVLLVLLAVTAILTLTAALRFSTQSTDLIVWGFGGAERARWWVGPEGSLNLRSSIPQERTAFDLRPAVMPPRQHAACELVLYNRWRDEDPENWERMNWSAIVGRGGHYRFGVEHGGTGTARPMVFAFEGAVGLPAHIPLQMVPEGGNVIELSERTRAVFDCNDLPNNATGMWLVFTNDQGDWSFKRVEVGAPNSAGNGYRALRVSN